MPLWLLWLLWLLEACLGRAGGGSICGGRQAGGDVVEGWNWSERLSGGEGDPGSHDLEVYLNVGVHLSPLG